MRRGQTDRGSSWITAWLGGSLGLHVILAAVATHLFSQPVPLPPRPAVAHAVELEATPAPYTPSTPASSQALAPDSPELAARLGDLHAALGPRPADSLSIPSPIPGALAGQGRPRPLPSAALTGEDLEELRLLPFNHRTRQSPNRIRTGALAVSPDNKRQTPNPAASPHLVSGGRGKTWRTRGRSSQRRGKDRLDSKTSVRAGGALDQAERLEEALADAPGADRFSRRRRTRQGAAPGFRRPDLERAPPTTLTRRLALALADDRVRHQASTRRIPDIMDAARATGTGERGGKGRGAASGRKGDAEGDLLGPAIWLNNPDNRYLLYFRRVHRKIQPLWAFPKQLEVMLEQGDVLVRFIIQQDGRVTDVRVAKPSGYPRFDRLVVAAIREAAPFGPIPRGLGRKVQVMAPFEFHNPLVR